MKDKNFLLGMVILSVAIVVAASIIAAGFSNLAEGVASGGSVISQGVVTFGEIIRSIK